MHKSSHRRDSIGGTTSSRIILDRRCVLEKWHLFAFPSSSALNKLYMIIFHESSVRSLLHAAVTTYIESSSESNRTRMGHNGAMKVGVRSEKLVLRLKTEVMAAGRDRDWSAVIGTLPRFSDQLVKG